MVQSQVYLEMYYIRPNFPSLSYHPSWEVTYPRLIASPCSPPAPSSLADCPLILRTTPRHLALPPPPPACPALWCHKFPSLVLFPHRKQDKRCQGCGQPLQARGGNTQNMTHNNTKPPGTISNARPAPFQRPSRRRFQTPWPSSRNVPATDTHSPRGPSSTVQLIKVRPPPEAPHASPASGWAETPSAVRTSSFGSCSPPGRRQRVGPRRVLGTGVGSCGGELWR